MRICSLLPSATEIVYALGLGDRLVAVTHECDYPEEASRLPAITRSIMPQTTGGSREIHDRVSHSLHGGSSIYSLDQELLERLEPDVILTQELCDVCAVSSGEVRRAVRRLRGERAILSLEPTSLTAILETIEQVGTVAGVPERAAGVVRRLQSRIDAVAAAAQTAGARPRVFAMDWLDPPFTAGHWVPEMVRLAGGRDELGREGRPSSGIAWADVAAFDPEIVVLMPCGLTLERTLEELGRASLPEEWSRLAAVRSGQVYAVNGSAYFNRPGPRIVDGLEMLAGLIHPEVFPPTASGAWKRLQSADAEGSLRDFS